MKTSYILLSGALLLAACGSGNDMKYAPGTANIRVLPNTEMVKASRYEVISKSDFEKRDQVGLQVTERALTPDVALGALAVAGATVREVADGFVVTVPDQAFFVHPSARISPNVMPYVTRLAGALLRDPSITLDIIAHYHFDGMNRKALVESEKRAVAFQAALMTRGVDLSRVRAIGAGDRNPVATNDTATGQQQNRRIEFHFKRGS